MGRKLQYPSIPAGLRSKDDIAQVSKCESWPGAFACVPIILKILHPELNQAFTTVMKYETVAAYLR